MVHHTGRGTIMTWYSDGVSSLSWHLFSIGLDKIASEYLGRGVSVGIFDDGVQSDHPQLIASYAPDLDLKLSGLTLNDAAGLHGTAVAGIIAAQANSAGAVGVASGA